MTPYIVKEGERFEAHTGSHNLTVCCGANQTITIHKLYGPLADFTGVRVVLEYTNDKADWVVSAFDQRREEWVEKARWDCQENAPEEE